MAYANSINTIGSATMAPGSGSQSVIRKLSLPKIMLNLESTVLAKE